MVGKTIALRGQSRIDRISQEKNERTAAGDAEGCGK